MSGRVVFATLNICRKKMICKSNLIYLWCFLCVRDSLHLLLIYLSVNLIIFCQSLHLLVNLNWN